MTTHPYTPLPEPYYATDRRCYNGAFCSDLTRQHLQEDKIKKRLLLEEPTSRTIYLPAEGIWYTHYYNNKDKVCIVPGDYLDKQTAMIKAISFFIERKN